MQDENWVGLMNEWGSSVPTVTECSMPGAQEDGEEPFNSCYLKHSAGERRGGGATAVRNGLQEFNSCQIMVLLCSMCSLPENNASNMSIDTDIDVTCV